MEGNTATQELPLGQTCLAVLYEIIHGITSSFDAQGYRCEFMILSCYHTAMLDKYTKRELDMHTKRDTCTQKLHFFQEVMEKSWTERM